MTDIETVLDRRLKDFEKVVETKVEAINAGVNHRLEGIQAGVSDMRDMLGIFVEKVSNMHEDYPTRREYEKARDDAQKERDDLKRKVEKLEAWRNSLAGAVSLLILLVGWAITSHFWK